MCCGAAYNTGKRPPPSSVVYIVVATARILHAHTCAYTRTHICTYLHAHARYVHRAQHGRTIVRRFSPHEKSVESLILSAILISITAKTLSSKIASSDPRVSTLPPLPSPGPVSPVMNCLFITSVLGIDHISQCDKTNPLTPAFLLGGSEASTRQGSSR